MSFELLTSISYWLLFIIWGVILALYLTNLRRLRAYGQAVSVLLIILALDAFRTLFESAYFGSYFTSLFGYLPISIYEFLATPWLLIIPKLLNLAVAVVILQLLIRHWLPREAHEREKLLHDRNESERQLRAAIMHSPLPTFIHAEDGQIIMTSDAVHKITGYRRSQMRTVREWVDLAYRERADEMLDWIQHQYDGQQKNIGEVTIITADNKTRIWDFDISSFGQHQDGRKLFISLARDVTNQKRIEAIRQLESELFSAMIARKDLNNLLTQVVLGIEKLMPDCLASVLLLDPTGTRLQKGATPNLPDAYNDAIDGAEIGPQAGSCGTAAFRGEPVIVEDIATDPLWDDYRHLALPYGLRACWSQPIFDDNQRVLATFAIYHDRPQRPSEADQDTIRRIADMLSVAISKKRTEAKVEENNQRFRRIFEQAATGVAITDLQGRYLEANRAYCEMLGYSEEELQQHDLLSLTHPDDRSLEQQEMAAIIRGDHKPVIEKRNLTRDGEVVWVRTSVSVQRDAEGQPLTMVRITENVTQAHRALERQREVERSMSQLLSNLPGVAYRCLYDESWTMLYLSEGFERVTGFPAADVIHNNKLSYLSLIHPEDRRRLDASVEAAIQANQTFQVEYRITCHDNTIRWMWEQGSAVHDSEGNIVALEGYITDITAQKSANQAIRESEERFRLLSRATNDAIWDWDLQTDTLWWNEGFEALFGSEPGEDITSLDVWIHRIHPDDRQRVLDNIDKTVDSGENSWVASYKFRRSNGNYADVLDRGYVIRDASRKATRMVGGMTDITERLQLEEQLRQSQRLEAVGQLTGGVAHDFNNLLTVIIGNSEILKESLDEQPALASFAEMVVEAAERGADLTRSLLAYARRQPLEPRATDINKLLGNLQTLLTRTLGETIQVEMHLDSTLNQAEIDPGQLENALLNLSLNARDAMPEGGRLVIETADVVATREYARRHDMTPGDYVMIAVSDSGVGIETEVLEKVFEPFFTTKSQGKGTGLGLAMVYGFIRQSRGHINIYSEPEQGTTVRLYLPVASDDMDSEPAIANHKHSTQSGHENILVVEDDPMVLDYVESQLSSLGYAVTTANSGQQALAQLESGLPVDLLFTDVVMPEGLSGRELADRAQLMRPGLKVLFTSGYTENAIVHHGRLDAGVMLLSKPYNRQQLALKIREALDNA